MRPEDEDGEQQQGTPDDHAGEFELPPSTFAARRRAAGERESGGPRSDSGDPEADASGEQSPAEDPGLTEEFGGLERELDADLGEDEPTAQAGEREPLDHSDHGEQPLADDDDRPEHAEPDNDAVSPGEADAEIDADAADPQSAAAEESEAAEENEAVESDEPGEADELTPAGEAGEAGEAAAGEGEPDHDEASEGEADEEVARDQSSAAALAGLRARAAKSGAWTTKPSPDGEEPRAGVAASAVLGEDGKVPRAKPLWARFLAATIVIVVSMAAATSISILLYLTDIARGLSDNGKFASLQERLAEVDGGDPQNILILGSDERLDTPGDPGRSDTTILLRVDPETQAISLLSIPRDLKVTIPNHGQDKFNAAYSYGGAKLTLRVVEQLTGLDINHLVNINFTGFADAVDAIDCVYVDVDRRYYIPPESGISEIDIEAGYQRLCGFKALQYVRFRHDDNDLVRSARQQDFLREARQKVPPSKLIEDRNELVQIFTDYTTSDIDDPVTMLELLKTFLAARNAELREVHFPADLGDGSTGYVTASNEAIKKTIAEFEGPQATPGPPEAGSSDGDDEKKSDRGGGDGEKKDKPKPEAEPEGVPMDDSSGQGQAYANQLSNVKTKGGEPMIRFPILYPTRLVPGSEINSASRAFVIDGPGKDKYWGYKMVVDVPGESFGNGLLTEYYGISGTDWRDPPILANPSERRQIDGREYLLFYDADRLRLVGWEDKKASYWVNNTLSQSLSEPQMLSIATSMRELGD